MTVVCTLIVFRNKRNNSFIGLTQLCIRIVINCRLYELVQQKIKHHSLRHLHLINNRCREHMSICDISQKIHQLFPICPMKQIIAICPTHNFLIVRSKSIRRTIDQKSLHLHNPVLYRILLRIFHLSPLPARILCFQFLQRMKRIFIFLICKRN